MHRTASAACAMALLIGAAACGGGDGGVGAFRREASSTTSRSTATTKATTTSVATGEIEQLQSELNALGCDAGTVDGSAGPGTMEAIKRFQTAAGLGVDGVAGPETQAKLAQAARDGEPNCRGGTSVPSPP